MFTIRMAINLEEEHPMVSSYVYTDGNPVKLIDVDGKETHVAQQEI